MLQNDESIKYFSIKKKPHFINNLTCFDCNELHVSFYNLKSHT